MAAPIHCHGVRFQSTHPVRGATSSNDDLEMQGLFQSTHPVRGATSHPSAASGRGIAYFNPRTP